MHNCAIRAEHGPTVWAPGQVLADRSHVPVVERAKGERREHICVCMERIAPSPNHPLLTG
jgi:hypothetical protein